MQQLFSLVPRNNTFSFASHKGGWGEVSEKNHYPSPALSGNIGRICEDSPRIFAPSPSPTPYNTPLLQQYQQRINNNQRTSLGERSRRFSRNPYRSRPRWFYVKGSAVLYTTDIHPQHPLYSITPYATSTALPPFQVGTTNPTVYTLLRAYNIKS